MVGTQMVGTSYCCFTCTNEAAAEFIQAKLAAAEAAECWKEEGHSTETGAALQRRRLQYDLFVLAAAAAAAAEAELAAAAAAAAEAGCSIRMLDKTLDVMDITDVLFGTQCEE